MPIPDTVELTDKTADTATALLKKQPAKRKVASKQSASNPTAGEPKPPRIPTSIDVPFSTPMHVPLSEADFTTKTRVMLRVHRELTNLKLDFEAEKARWKKNIKDKEAEIEELNGELQSGTEEREVALIARYFPKKKLKRVLDAGTKKKVRDEPMTPAEVREYAQPTLISVPATPPPAPATAPTPAAAAIPGEGHIAETIPAAMDNLVPVGTAALKDGEKPPVPGRTNPDKIEDVIIEGEEDDENPAGLEEHKIKD